MRRLRFTIAQLMGIVILIGLGFAALRNANEIWASATFSVAIVSVSVAIAGAWSRNAGARMPWAGFGIAGGLCLVIWLWTYSQVDHSYGPPYYPLIHRLQPYINPQASAGPEIVAYTRIAHSLDVVLLGWVGAVFGRFLAVKDERRSA
jgi:hypothetical protein